MWHCKEYMFDTNLKSKGFPRLAEQALMGDTVFSVLSLNIRRGWDVTATPGCFTPG